MSYILAIDGMCGSGKSTMADTLQKAYGGSIIHMDDFFLPPEKRTRERLQEPGGNVDYERFEEQVLSGLKGEQPFTYQRFSCRTMSLQDFVEVDPRGLVIVEGAYSHHPRFGEYMNKRVFLEVDGCLQKKRIIARGGLEAYEAFRTRWIPMEETYFKTFRVRQNSAVYQTDQGMLLYRDITK